MANEDQLAVLRKGAEAWNEWRRENDAEAINLGSANLSRADLGGADLNGTNLGGADLSGANLRHAELYGADLLSANLSGANLSDAKLRRANLSGADLRGANLSRANLSDAYLVSANLRRADLSGADLHTAILAETLFVNVDLRHTAGLNSCVHEGPSTIDHRTLAQSGPLPLCFLRGCGLPENLITYIPSIFNQSIQFYSCFISYSTKDQDFADRLHADLQNKGVRCWFAPHDMAGGKKVHEQIDEAIRVYDRLLLILSEHSMNSRWVKTEIANARRKELAQNRQVLFPIRLVDYEAIRPWKLFDADAGDDSAAEVREYFIPDFSNWDKDHAAYT